MQANVTVYLSYNRKAICTMKEPATFLSSSIIEEPLCALYNRSAIVCLLKAHVSFFSFL